MHHCVIYYFSATGNSLAVAIDLADRLGCSEPISITGARLLDDPYQHLREAEKVGFVFPVYRGSIPDTMRSFLEGMPEHPAKYHFAVSTYSFIGCNEFWDIDELLRQRGVMLNYVASIRMPGNVGLVEAQSDGIYRRLALVDDELKEISEEIAADKENMFPRSVRALGVMTRAYSEYRQRTIRFHVRKSCTLCGTCMQVCPTKNISMPEDENGVPTRMDHCIVCLACVHWCPERALSTARGLHLRYHHPEITPEQLNRIPDSD
ncbi:MAG: EFR1 family ferrodoxin [Coriobacteriia bacterium]|nr:EFR1 family ferrodoxin [Coriobacteriia bacterium]